MVGNGTSKTGFDAAVDTFPIVIAIFIVLANGFVLYLVAKNHRLRSITNAFLISLAISDLLTGAVGIPFNLACSVTYQYSNCAPAAISWRFTSISSILHLSLVTMDRYAAIVYAIRYHAVITRTVATVSIAVVWVTSASVALIQLAWPRSEEPEGTPMTEEEEQQYEAAMEKARSAAIYQIVTLILFFGIPFIFMVFSYIRIFAIVRYHEKQINKMNMPSVHLNGEEKKATRNSIQAQWKSAIIFLVMTAIFIVCWLPFFIYRLRELYDMFELPHWAEYVFFYYPRFVTSLTNPILYVFGKHDFRKVLFPAKRKSRMQSTSLLDQRTSTV